MISPGLWLRRRRIRTRKDAFARSAYSLRSNKSGLATIEFAMIVSFLGIALLNVSDVAVYLFDKIQVNNATQMGAQAAWASCDLNHLPASVKCPAMNGAVTTAIQATALGTGVTLQSGSPS